MKVLIYINTGKDINGEFLSKISLVLKDENIEYEQITSADFDKRIKADALFVYGGDGTILTLLNFACFNNLPIVGINAGKIGFMTEFEVSEIKDAVSMLKNGSLIQEERILLDIEYNGKNYLALNDAVIHAILTNNRYDAKIINLRITVDGIMMNKIIGDGVVVSTPTGSTAYSFAAGGAILAPQINAFIISPLCTQFFNRPVVVSSESVCKLTNLSGKAGLYIDGEFVGELMKDEQISISKSKLFLRFLRKKDSNFYKKLVDKLMIEK